MNGGRPLRFLLLVTGGWVAARAVMLWPAAAPISAVREAFIPRASAESAVPAAANWRAVMRRIETGSIHPRAATARASRPAPFGTSPVPASVAAIPVVAVAPTGQTDLLPGLPKPPVSASASRRSRVFGSFWLFVRGGNGPAGGVPGVQLGGSQAGARLAYALTATRRLALAARVTSPLGPGLREAALGVEWQPTRLPVRIVAEQRFALNQGRGGPTLALVGGAGPLPVAAGFALEAYGQGGIIGRDGVEGFADGAVRLARPVGRIGGVRFDLGTGGWGAAQRGATRLDIGPSLSARVPLGRQAVRISLDWRERVAGNAAPGSGLVLTLGADF